MTVHHDAGMRSPSRSRRWTALGLVGLVLLAGCSVEDGNGNGNGDATEGTAGVQDGGGGGDEAAGTAGEGSGEGSGATAGPPTEPADIAPVVAGRSASGGDGAVTVEGDHAGFVLPSGNIACSVTAASAVCQVADKDYTPSGDHLASTLVGDCTVEEADAIMLSAERGAWTCLPEPLVGQAAVEAGGWWAEEAGGDTTDVDGATVAVLPYGSSLTLGPVTCSSAEDGVRCDSDEIGKSFLLSTTTYQYD